MRSTLSVGALALCFGTSTLYAQNANVEFADTAANHWAYQAIQDLANRGLVKGYKDAKALKGRDLTRFEFASLVSRVMDRLSTVVERKQGDSAIGSLNQDTLNEIQVLKETFRPQLEAMQADLKKAQQDIEDLRSQVEDAKSSANKAQKQADSSFGVGSGHKFQISGYIQGRYTAASSRDDKLFPSGSPTGSSGYNGNYLEGGSSQSFLVRRSRLKVTGAITQNTRFAIQLDASGLMSGSNQAVSVREGNVTYTPGDGTAKNPAFTVGLFANPFGYALPLSSANIVWPERPLAFNENSEGIFSGQDYDRGVQISYSPTPIRLTAAFVNGSGRGSNDTDRRIDTVLRAAYSPRDDSWGVGASYYDGDISYSAAPPYAERKKQLLGLDAHYTSPKGPFVLGEFLAGTFEQRTYMDATALKLTTAAAPGNRIQGYYLTGGWNFGAGHPHPWALAISYDVLRRSTSGMADSGSDWNDVNLGIGALYNLDAATRLRFWYTSPSSVAHPAGTPEPRKIGLLTAELQVKF